MKKRTTRPDKWWTRGFRARDVGATLRLTPYWETGVDKSDRLRLILDPGPAFGVGDHPSTIMALELLELAMEERPASRTAAPPSLLDVGAGTGVIAIAAKLLGAGFTAGLDIDSSAVFTARRNLALNGLGRRSTRPDDSISFFVGPIEAVSHSFDIVAANLAAPTLLRLAPSIKACSAGALILSGVADAMVDQVLSTYSTERFDLCCHRNIGGWNAMLFEVDPGRASSL